MSLRKKARKLLEGADLDEAADFGENVSASKAHAGGAANERKLEAELDAVRDTVRAKDKDLAKRDREIAELRARFERLESDRESAVTDLQARIKEIEGNLKSAQRELVTRDAEADKLRAKIAAQADAGTTERALAGREAKLSEQESLVKAQLEELGSAMATLDSRGRELFVKDKQNRMRQEDLTRKARELEDFEKKLFKRENEVAASEKSVQDHETKTESAQERLQQDREATLRTHIAIGPGIERLAAALGRQHTRL